jgi:hypothetical protein
VDRVGLGGGHPDDPVTARDLAACGDSALAPDADPQPRQRAKCRLPPLLGRRATEEDLINDDPGPGTRHGREDPGIAWTSVSVPSASHGSGRTVCRHRAIPDFPALEPPLRTIT